jgi:hypothetical protein
VPPNYISADELKASLELTGQTYADHDVPMAIEAASRAVDNMTRRRYYLDESDQTRWYSSHSGAYVLIDDLHTLTSLENDGTAWTVDDEFWLEPVRMAIDGKPYDVIRPVNGAFLSTSRGIKVIGRFGWPQVPAEVLSATPIIATQLLRRAREAPFGVINFGLEGEAVRISRFDPQIDMLLTPYTRSSLIE